MVSDFVPNKILNCVFINMILQPVFYILLGMNVVVLIDKLFTLGIYVWPHIWILFPATLVVWIGYRWTEIIIVEYINSGEYDRDKRRAKEHERS